MIITSEDLKKINGDKLHLINEIIHSIDPDELAEIFINKENIDVKLLINGKEVEPVLLNAIFDNWVEAIDKEAKNKLESKFYLLRKKLDDFIEETLDELDFK